MQQVIISRHDTTTENKGIKRYTADVYNLKGFHHFILSGSDNQEKCINFAFTQSHKAHDNARLSMK